MLRICISGLTASGKTTLGEMLAKELNIRHISASYKAMEKDLSKMAGFIDKSDTEWTKEFDRRILGEACKTDCVVTAHLAPWLMRDATLRVKLDASLEERARRRAKQLSVSKERARKLINGIDRSVSKMAKRVYGIDRNDNSVFDLILNTERLSHKECVSLIAMLALERERLRFR